MGIVEGEKLTPGVQAPITFSRMKMPVTRWLWAKVMSCAYGALSQPFITSSSGNKSSQEIFHGKASPVSPYPFFEPGYILHLL